MIVFQHLLFGTRFNSPFLFSTIYPVSWQNADIYCWQMMIYHSASLYHSIIRRRTSAQNSVQVNFRQRVLFRDNCCVFCGYKRKAALKAAQIFDVIHADDRVEYKFSFLCQYRIMNFYDTENGLTLCSRRYDVFDALLCCVVVEYDATGSAAVYKLAIVEATKNSPQFAGERAKFDGSLWRVPTDPVRRKY